MELLSQLDGFEKLGQVKLVAATNRPDVLDPALMRPGRLDRKIEIPLPNEQVGVSGIRGECEVWCVRVCWWVHVQGNRWLSGRPLPLLAPPCRRAWKS